MYLFVPVFESRATASRTPLADSLVRNKDQPPRWHCLCTELSSSSALRPSSEKHLALRSALNCDPSPQPARRPDSADRPGFSRCAACPPIPHAASSLRHPRTCKFHLHSCCRHKSC